MASHSSVFFQTLPFRLPSATIIEVVRGLVDAAILACTDAAPRPLVSQGKVVHIFRQDCGQVSIHARIAVPWLCAVWPFFRVIAQADLAFK